jgi:hypothetical protein
MTGIFPRRKQADITFPILLYYIYTSRGTVLCMAQFDKSSRGNRLYFPVSRTEPGADSNFPAPGKSQSGRIITCRVPEGQYPIPDGIFIGLSHAQNHAARSIYYGFRPTACGRAADIVGFLPDAVGKVSRQNSAVSRQNMGTPFLRIKSSRNRFFTRRKQILLQLSNKIMYICHQNKINNSKRDDLE